MSANVDLGWDVCIAAAAYALAAITIPLWGPIWVVGWAARRMYPEWALERDHTRVREVVGAHGSCVMADES